MNSETTYDFSIRTVPDDWTEAESDGPPSDATALKPKRTITIRPASERVDVMTSVVSALAISLALGVTWYLLEVQQVTDTPLFAIAAGVLISICVRLGGGPGDPDVRATISFVFYLTTLLITTYLIQRHRFGIIYNDSPSLSESEHWLIRDRFSEPMVMLSWFAGLALSTQISYLTRNGR